MGYSAHANFEALVPVDGMAWRDDLTSENGQAGPWLVWPVPSGRSIILKRRPVHSASQLARQFVKAKVGQSEIMRLANRWGPLTCKPQVLAPPAGGPIWTGDHASSWIETIDELRRLLVVIDLLSVKGAGRLGQMFTWRGSDGSIHFSTDPKHHGQGSDQEPVAHKDMVLATDWFRPGLKKQLPFGAVRKAAEQFVIDAVERELARHMKPVIVPDQSHRLLPKPDCLRAAAFVGVAEELAFVLSGVERKMATCPMCGTDFTSERNTRVYCGERCRKKAFDAKRRADGGR